MTTSVAAQVFRGAVLPVFQAALRRDRVGLHVASCFLRPVGLSQIHKYGHLMIKRVELPNPPLMELNKHSTLRLEGSRSPGLQGDGTGDRKLDLSHGSSVLSGC